MYNNLETTQRIFTKIQNEFPLLHMTVHKTAFTKLSMHIPAQEGLKFDVHLNLKNTDELQLSAGIFSCEWYPCTQQKKVDQFLDAVNGILSGEYRILEHYRWKFAVKAQLQIFDNDGWKTVATWGTFHFPWPWKKEYHILQNLP